MSCPPPDRVLDYVARRLDARERDAIDAHVDGCSACRALLVELVRTDPDDVVELAPAEDPVAIGRYKVIARIGDGGMGTVFAAYDPQLDRRVAVKLVHPELAVRGGKERLLREGRALARLSHPNVVAVHDAGTDGDRLYVAMELIDGQTLAAWLAAAPRGWRAITELFVAAGRGIAAAHEAGIVHRDVKPENVLIDRDGRAKVADFGLAGHSDPLPSPDAVEPAASSRLTRPGTIMGTPLFMSPEQRSGGDVGPATDQYSLCAALANALGDANGPRWLRRAIARGMATAPADRFGSIDELVAALDPERHARRARWFAVAAAAALVAAGGLAYAATRAPDAVDAACDRAAAQQLQLWTASDRHATVTALLATGVPSAPETWPRVEAAVDVYATDIAAAQTKLCSRRPNTPESEAAFDQATMCLVEKRLMLAGLIGQLRVIGAADVPNAVSAVHGLEPVEACANAPVLAAEHAARSTPLGLARRDAIALEFQQARVALDAGDYPKASAHARQAVAYARTFGGVVLARALLGYAEICDGFAPRAETEAAVREAATAAETGQDDGLRALALAQVMSVMAHTPGREKEALAFQPLVAAAIARSGDTELEPIMQQAAGTAQMRLGQSDAAIASYTAALATARKVLPPRDPRLPEYIYPLGVALGMVRRDAEAARYHAEAYQVASDIWGPSSPNAVRYQINLAVKHGALGDCPTALVEAGHARAVLRGVLPPHSPEQLLIAEIMGTCYGLLHDHEAALREHQARRAALEAAGEGHGVDMAQVEIDVGDVELDRKRPEPALASFRAALADLEDVVGKADPRLCYPLGRIGEAELAAGHPERAREVLERAAAIYAANQTPALLRADIDDPLARAVWPIDRARARTLATGARAAYAAGGPQFASQVAALDAWLHAHP